MLTSDDVNTILIDVMTGRAPSIQGDEAQAMHDRLRQECADIIAKGGSVDVPPELPDLSIEGGA